MKDFNDQYWHNTDVNEILDLFKTDLNKGLSEAQVKEKEEIFGKNLLKEKKTESKIKIFFSQFHNPLIYILLSATLITAFLNEWIDSGIIFAVVIINVIVGFIQEVKAAKAIDSLKNMMTTEAMVIREGEKVHISSRDVVPGDVILLESGSKVAADIRVVNTKDLKVDESMLTGESLSVSKENEILQKDIILNDRTNMLYSGTFATYGRGKGIVIATGQSTELGKISNLMEETTALETPLTQKISAFSKILLYVILGLASFTFIIGLLRQNSMIETFMASVALAVGTIPEGLPAAVTITLAIGVSTMAKKNAIIRKLPAVETLGSVTTICSDKTGTLTQNRMTVTEVFTMQNSFKVEGNGYEPKGNFFANDKKVDNIDDDLFEILQAGYLCNESHLAYKNGVYEIKGDPTEGALIVSFLKSGSTEKEINENYPRIDILPFESNRQYMATMHNDLKAKNNILYLKGSIEKILQKCKSDTDIEKIEKEAAAFALKGLRVLAVCKKATDKTLIDEEILSNEFEFLGLFAIMDPPRAEAVEAVRECKTAGINIKMITGDHALTAFSISKMLNIVSNDTVFEGSVLEGKELFKLSDEQLAQKVQNVNIFARVEPEQKLRIVNALQANGHIVAMTGDGVNDAPALKQANIGIAMGKGGTEVAKEAADMILSDDNFSSIVQAVKEGRNVYDNLIKFITWTLPTNLGEGLVLLVAIALGLTLPILPVQILWINMSTAILLGLMLVFEPKEKNIMNREPVEPSLPILTRGMIFQMGLVGVYMLIASYSLFNYYLSNGYSVEYARTVAVNIFVFIEIFYLFNCKELSKTVFETDILNNKYLLYGIVVMVTLQLGFTNAQFMNSIFKTTPLEISTWGLILAVSFMVIFVVDIFNKYKRTL